MALVLNDRVLEQSSTAGTGTVSLSGAVAGYKSFANGVGDGQTCYYTIYDPTAFTWEVGIGTYTLSGSTLSRTTVLSNSLNTTALISFAANAKNVFVTYPASKSVNVDTNGNTSLGGLAGMESLRVTPVASAVNWVQTAGATTTNAPNISAQGSDTNINLTITPKGTGATYSPNFAASNGLVMNNASINTSYTLPTGYNAMSVGPVTVVSGVTVTVPSGSVWAII